MKDRTLPLDPEQVAALRALDDKPFRSAGEEIRHDSVDGDPPPRDCDAGLARRNEDAAQSAPPRLEIQLADRRHLPDRAVGADREHDLRIDLEVRAGRRTEIGRRLAQVAELDAVTTSEVDELRVVVQADV